MTVLKDQLRAHFRNFQAGASLRPFLCFCLLSYNSGTSGANYRRNRQTSSFAITLQHRITFNDGSFQWSSLQCDPSNILTKWRSCRVKQMTSKVSTSHTLGASQMTAWEKAFKRQFYHLSFLSHYLKSLISSFFSIRVWFF